MANFTWHPLVQIPRTSSTLQQEPVSGQWNLVVPLFLEVTQDTNLASQCLPLSSSNRNRSLPHPARIVCPLPVFTYPHPTKLLSVFPLIYNSKSMTQKMNGSSLRNSTTSMAAPSQHVSKTHHLLLEKRSMHLPPEVILSSKICVSKPPTTGV
jgi:hypothetical protein